ncbi:hypothetical protein MAPG_09872 [Magnaporthiopsis poae ATCC 64411]|uniref:SET domain-containing protein n=1 Tax=Magnaporthiopsis poae (strain ATCC 64411 / 73-15) TaxID=644358 RepID=A0A0C4EB29_MAGP6|nr:hypothetical protein MAPG_09872 [Magnaporthiopsis poae ATCC 64411]
MLGILVICTAVLSAALARAETLWEDPSPLIDKATNQTFQPNNAAGWQGPESCSGKWCLYWNPQYNNGQGLALITSAEHAKEAATYIKAPPTTAPENHPFRVADIPGKGRGLVATRLIAKGEVVMAVRPVLVVEVDAYHGLPEAEAKRLYGQALDRLSKTAKEGFMSQTGDDLRDKLARNTFTVWIGSRGRHMGAYPQASLVNHDCRPSTTYRLSNLTHTTTAVRDIQPGEEISISYIDVLHPRDKRQAWLREWGALVEEPTRHWTWGLRKATGQGRTAAAADDKAVKDEL